MKPLLAATSDGNNLPYPILVSPKLDGIRCLIIDGSVYSRSLKLIPNKYIQSLFGNSLLNGLDGELIVGSETAPDVYQQTVSGVMSINGEPNVVFKVFDDFTNPELTFRQRYSTAQTRVSEFCNSFCIMHCGAYDISVVDHKFVNNPGAFLDLESSYLALGYEGIMVRSATGQYKFGRSTLKEGTLLKVKRFVDSEAVIIDFTELEHNANEKTVNELGANVRSSKKAGKVPMGKLGAFIVRDVKTGVEFSIGTGFNDFQRTDFWLLRQEFNGRIVKYKSQPVGVKDRPRFPVFLGFRHPSDM